MPSFSAKAVVSALLFSLAWEARAVEYPVPVLPGDARLGSAPWSATGIVQAKVGRRKYDGSAAIARDPRLLYGCGHVVYDRGVWASEVAFARAYSGQRRPRQWTKARGFHLMEGYAETEDFDRDFSVAYSPMPFGPQALEVYASGADSALSSDLDKIILGYPSYRDYDFMPGYYYLHQTGVFNFRFVRETGPYFTADDVSTGPGNSGGPVLVEEEGSYVVAGVLVSGNDMNDWPPLFAGVHALDAASEVAADAALYDAKNGTPRTVQAKTPVRLKDGSRKFRRLAFSFRKSPAMVTSVTLALRISAVPGAVDVFLRSPSGREEIVVDSSNASTWPNQDDAAIDLTDTFANGSDGAGKWTLFCRASKAGSPAVVLDASLTVTAR